MDIRRLWKQFPPLSRVCWHKVQGFHNWEIYLYGKIAYYYILFQDRAKWSCIFLCGFFHKMLLDPFISCSLYNFMLLYPFKHPYLTECSYGTFHSSDPGQNKRQKRGTFMYWRSPSTYPESSMILRTAWWHLVHKMAQTAQPTFPANIMISSFTVIMMGPYAELKSPGQVKSVRLITPNPGLIWFWAALAVQRTLQPEPWSYQAH